MMPPALLGAALFFGCGATDDDYDGFSTALDCDDSNPAISPAALELCDGIDNDCDGEVDNDPIDGGTWYIDADDDGFGVGLPVARCDGDGHAANDADCNDASAETFPGAEELCDGADNDCDGDIDDGADTTTWYIDSDGDGYGSSASSTVACTAPAGHVASDDDCNDHNDEISPETRWYLDSDGDSYGTPLGFVQSCTDPSDEDTGYVSSHTDCDDTDAAVFPGAVSEDPSACLIDEDGDGFGSATPPEGIDAGTDCVDEDASIHPGIAAEDPSLCMQDEDGDGYGAADPTWDTVDVGTDCDDADAGSHPGATEYCDGADNDCSGVADEDYAVDAEAWYRDSDGDGFGDPDHSTVSCESPPGHSTSDQDCDDSDALVSPEAWEDCTDGVDNDCDGDTDEACIFATSSADVTVTGSDTNGYMGEHGLEIDGDLSGDGYADMAVGVNRVSSNKGKVYVLAGPITAGAALRSEDDAFAAITGEDATDYLGYTLDVGDIDGDGYDDLVTGAYLSEGGTVSNTGGVFAFYGPLTGQIDAADADLSFWGVNAADYYGELVATLYDYDGDGAAEVIGGSDNADPGGLSSAGIVGIHSGGQDGDTYEDAQTLLYGSSSGGKVGASFDGPGDLDGDGHNDLLFGAPGADEAYAVFGPTTGLISSADADVFFSHTTSTNAGSTVDSGDYNGDGYIDVVVGAYSASSQTGLVYLFSGPISGSYTISTDYSAQISGDDTGEYFGRYDPAAESGDVDGDGLTDFLIGSYACDTASNSAGGAFLFYGPISGSQPVSDGAVILYGSSSTSTGTGVSIGDISGDGSSDIAASSYRASSYDGEAYVLLSGSF